MNIIGIDPGLKGAIAVFSDGRLYDVWDMPTYQIKSGKSKKNFVDPAQLHSILSRVDIDEVWLEKVHAMPGQGVTSMFNFGMGYGIILGVVASLKLPINHVTPQKWKKALTVPAGKDGARHRATELMPYASDMWPLKKHEGRSEAAMIAFHGTKQNIIT